MWRRRHREDPAHAVQSHFQKWCLADTMDRIHPHTHPQEDEQQEMQRLQNDKPNQPRFKSITKNHPRKNNTKS